MDTQKGSSKLSATLLALILGASVFMAGPVWAAKYVTDPTTGKVVTAPEYGGTLTQGVVVFPPGIDNWWKPGWAAHIISGVNEGLAFADWGLSRDIWGGRDSRIVTPEMTRGALAESWSMPDATTFIWNIRQGVSWDNKAPVNGRQFDAFDVEWNYHRYLGLGDFTEDGPSPSAGAIFFGLQFESVTATDKWTVEIKLKQPHPDGLGKMLNNYWVAHAPEQIEKYGDAKDWRNVVGTGPFRLTEFVEGSSATWQKNPNYWGYDEKFPENRLPYIDELRSLLIPEMSARLAALRTGKIDMLSNTGDAVIYNIDDLESLQRTNPEIEVWPVYSWIGGAYFFNWALPPVSDVNVRKALQMSVDRKTISAAFLKGWGNPAPYGLVQQDGQGGYSWPYEDWPDEVKQEYTYNPERAEELLDAAGYTRGADGYRFKLKISHFDRYDPTYGEIIMGYFEAIGVDSELVMHTAAELSAIHGADTHEWALGDWAYGILGGAGYLTQQNQKNKAKGNDRVTDALFAAMQAAATSEEWKSLHRQVDEITIREHWGLVKSNAPKFHVSQPWVEGYFGEAGMGRGERNTFLARLWIDSELKKEMGH